MDVNNDGFFEKQNEPDKYAMDIECTKCGAKQSGVLTVHTTPPQRTWVGLTDEHKEGLICMTNPNPEPHHLRELIDVVEFQLKERNT